NRAVLRGEDAQGRLGLRLEQARQRRLGMDVAHEALHDLHDPLLPEQSFGALIRAREGAAGEVPDDLAEQVVAAADAAVERRARDVELVRQRAHVEAATV